MLRKLGYIGTTVLVLAFLLSLLVDHTVPYEKGQRLKPLELTKTEKEKIQEYLKGVK